MDLNLYRRQLKNEIAYREEAQERLRESNTKGEQRGYASSTSYNQILLKKSLASIGERLTTRLCELRRGSAGVDHSIVNKHLKNAKPNVIALLSLKVAMDVLGKENKPKLVEITLAMGRAVETELRLNYYFKSDKDLYKLIERQFHPSTGTRQKGTVFKLRFNREGIEWNTWSNATAHKIGSWCLEAVAKETGWLRKETIATAKRKHRTVVRYSPEFLKLKEAIIEKSESLAFLTYPMVCEPVEWSRDQRGGYLTEDIQQQHPMVRARGSLQQVKQGHIPIKMLNNVQRVAYRINPQVLSVINWCHENHYTVGKFRSETARPIPDKPVEGSSEEDIKKYKKQRRQLEDFNAQIEQKNWRSTELKMVANRFKDEERIFFPHSFCYRGRIYPLTTAISPQGTDPEKALLYFVDEGPVHKFSLAWHVATCYGLDKKTHGERIKWTVKNQELITLVAQDPIGNRHIWEAADEPFCFLASCFEYFSCVITSTKTTSGLPIGVDATNSGLQHLSALTSDYDAASKCNVTPTSVPADAYRSVAEASLKYIEDKSIHSYIDRHTCKRVTMCVPYGVSRDSARNYIKEELKLKDFDLSIRGRLTEITKAIYDKAIPEIFAGPVAVMHWLQQSAKDILQVHDVIQWKTPSGFIVVQDLRQSKAVRVQTRLMGSVVSCLVGNSWGDPDVKHHVSALAPNVVHSMDSSMLHLCFAYWDKPFQVIHDCVSVRSCDVKEISSEIRLHFVEMYKAGVLEDWAEQVGVEIPESLIKNTLDIEEVHDSEYFFC